LWRRGQVSTTNDVPLGSGDVVNGVIMEADISGQRDPFPLYRFEGDHAGVGRAHGEALGDLVDDSLDVYRELFADLVGLDWPEVLALSAQVQRVIEDFDPDSAREMEGIAAGADVDPLAIVALNARSDILHLAGISADVVAALGAPADECTSLALLPHVTADGHVILVQNWDNKLSLQPQTVVMQLDVAGEPSVIFFTEAGIIVRSGLNSHGIGVTGNAMRSDQEFSQGLGIPETVVRRRVLRQRSFAPAIGEVLNTPRSHSINHLLADAAGAAVDLEAIPSQVFSVAPVDGILVHSNHFTAPGACAAVRDENPSRHPSTLYRDCRARDALTPKAGNIVMDDVQAAMRDHFGYPDAVCKHPDDPSAHDAGGTIASAIMDVTARALFIAPGPVCENDYERYDLVEATS